MAGCPVKAAALIQAGGRKTTADQPQGIALPTGVVQIKNAKGEQTAVRVLLDQCAQKTFVNQATVAKLNLRPHGKQDLTVCGFGQTGKKGMHGLVSLTIMSREGDIPIQAVVTPRITEPIHMLGRADASRNLMSKVWCRHPDAPCFSLAPPLAAALCAAGSWRVVCRESAACAEQRLCGTGGAARVLCHVKPRIHRYVAQSVSAAEPQQLGPCGSWKRRFPRQNTLATSFELARRAECRSD